MRVCSSNVLRVADAMVIVFYFFSFCVPIVAQKDLSRSAGCGTAITGITKNPFKKKQEYDGQKLPVFYQLPSEYDAETNDIAVPLVLYFHGFTGKPDENKKMFQEFGKNGIMSVGLTGMGDSTSWKFSGSTESPGPLGPTCNEDIYFDDAYPACNTDCGVCEDQCSWTTCKDSVEQTKELLEQVLDEFCIDLSRIFVHGSSNGGMFTYELAKDERTAHYLAGIITDRGLPHYGFNFGPASTVVDGVFVPQPISILGIWGEKDDVVPPSENPADDGTLLECRSSEEQGWFYTTAACTLKKWADVLLCNNKEEPLEPFDQKVTRCWTYENGCYNDNINGNPKVIGCIANMGHYDFYEKGVYAGLNFAYQYMIDFVLSNPRMIRPNDGDIPTPSPVPSPVATCADEKKKKACNKIVGCSWMKRGGKKSCNKAFSTEKCMRFSKRRKCKKKGCRWNKQTRECVGRWTLNDRL